MATAQETTMSAEQLFDTPSFGRCELVRGEVIMTSPAGYEHGVIVGNIHTCLATFVKQRSLGIVTAAETGFIIGRSPDTVRAPDVGFIQTDRMPRQRLRGYFEGAPDLAVEVVSPTDRAGEVLAKVQNWLSCGCRAVWVVDPTSQTISVYHHAGSTAMLTMDDDLIDEEVLPGFRLPVAEVF